MKQNDELEQRKFIYYWIFYLLDILFYLSCLAFTNIFIYINPDKMEIISFLLKSQTFLTLFIVCYTHYVKLQCGLHEISDIPTSTAKRLIWLRFFVCAHFCGILSFLEDQNINLFVLECLLRIVGPFYFCYFLISTGLCWKLEDEEDGMNKLVKEKRIKNYECY
ncbi:hypothetical protein L5515_013646 [Caenorhabditis briggsae]|uniref:Uncharacterized protein n=1 Tax=Caenorhabditis briggsae TaxID=6238 RepID=A0AAE9EC47_CAEBR|nr:hypothetical protein L5515_013646 [Caenorhabditis briggsae]